MRACTILCVATLLLAVTVLGQVYDERYYPSPQVDYFRCGRRSRSYICDPEGVLEADDAAQLDAELYKIVKDTQCPCSNYACRQNPSGYKVGIAIVKRLSAEERLGDVEHHVDLRREETRRRMEKTLDDAKRVAFSLQERWNLGQCDEDVLILYSRDDDVIFTVTGSVARLKLDDSLVTDIALDSRRENIENYAFRGLMRIVESYRYVFMNQYMAAPRTGPLRSSNTGASLYHSNHVHQSIWATMMALSAAILLSRGYLL